MAGLHFEITGDNSNLMRKLRETENGVKSTAKEIEKSGESINGLFNKIAKSAAAIGAGFSASQLVRQVVEIRGQFQQLEVAFETMLGSKERANELMQEMTRLAATTPFQLTDVTNGAKQLLAYGESADNIVDTLTMLGNVAAGLSIPLNDLTYLYGTTMTQGRLYAQDFYQFTGRGIPMVRELAKEFGVAESEVKGLVEQGKVGFPEVQKVLRNLTSEGGMFYNLMENQSKTITGQISNLGDAWDMMMNEIGTSTQGIISGAISTVAELVENYETVLQVLKYVIVAYGSYKGALMLVAAAQKIHNAMLVECKLQMKLAAAEGIALSKAQAVAAARTSLLTGAFNKLKAAFASNPIGIVVTLLSTLAVGIYDAVKESNKFSESMIDLNEVMADFHSEVAKEREEIDRLFGTLEGAKEGSEEYKEAKQQIIDQYGKYLGGLVDERGELINLEAAYNRVTAAAEASAKARAMTDARSDAYKEYTERVTEIQKGLRDAFKLYYEAWEDNPDMQSQYSPMAAESLIARTMQELNKTGKIPEDLLKRYPEFQGPVAVNPIRQNLLGLQEQYGILQKTIKETEQLFGASYADPEEFAGMTDEVLKANLNELKKVQKRWEVGERNFTYALQNHGKSISIRATSLDKIILDLENYEQEINRRAAEASVSDSGAVESYAPGGSARSTADEEAKARAEAEEKAGELLRRIIEQNQKDELDLMKEGAEKRKAQAAADLSARLMEARDMARQMKEANMAAGKGEELDTEQTEALKSMYDNAAAIYKKAIADINEEERKANEEAYNAYIRQYGDYQEKRKAIADEYAKKIEEAGGEDTWQGKLLAKQRDAEFSDLDFEAAKTTSKINELFDDMTDKTLKDLERIYDYGKLLLDFLSSGKWDAETGKSLGISEEQFNTISKDPEKLKATSDNLKNIKETADEMRPAISKITKGFHDLFNSKGDSKKLTEALSLVSDGVGAVTNALGFLSDSFTKLFEAFGSDAFSGVADGIKVATDTLSGAMSGAQAGAAFGPIGAGVGAALGLVSSLASSLAELHDAKIEEKIQDIEDSVENLDKAYEKLGREADKAFSTEAAGLIGEQNKNLQQQKRLIEEQIALEQTKKDADEDRIKEWRDEIDEINEQMADNKEAAIEAITGTDIMSAIDEFAQAYADAWANGTSAAKASADVVKSLIRTSMLTYMKSLLSPEVEKFMKKLGEFMKDGVLEEWEKTALDAIAKDAEDVANNYMDLVGDYFKEDTEQQSASSRAFGTEMTQDQAAEISGRLTAVYDAELDIRNQVIASIAALTNLSVTCNNSNIVLSEIRNLMISSTSFLDDIAKYSKKIYNDFYARLNEIATNTQ